MFEKSPGGGRPIIIPRIRITRAEISVLEMIEWATSTLFRLPVDDHSVVRYTAGQVMAFREVDDVPVLKS